MVSYPNQRIVTINRNMPNKQQNKNKEPFALLYLSAIDDAARKINSQVGFKLWLYFASNQDGYVEAFSPEAVKERMGVSLNRARDAFKKLIELKYLVLQEGSKNRYLFYERPHTSLTAGKIRKIFYDEDGSELKLTYEQVLKLVNDEKKAMKLWLEAKEDK